MSQDQQQLQFDTSGQSQAESEPESTMNDHDRMVPVSEAIKYRRRAQTAEQEVEALAQQLKDSEKAQREVHTRYDEAILENRLTKHLLQAGALDIEVALLLARQNAGTVNGEKKDIECVIDNLRAERPYLFSCKSNEVISNLAGPTAGVRGQNTGSMSHLTRLAQKAQVSGSRKDMQEYLRVKRSIRV